MDQKAKDNSGSGLSWHLGRGLAIPSLRLFRGFQGRVVWWIWDLENRFYSHRDYCGDFLSALFLFSFVRSMLSIKRFPGSKVQRCVVPGKFLQTKFPCIWLRFSFFDMSNLGLIYVPWMAFHISHIRDLCITLATWRMSVECMPRSSGASLHLYLSIVTFSLFLILAFQLWPMHVKLQNSILGSHYRRVLLYCVNSLWTIHVNFEIRYLLYGIPIPKVHVKPRLGQPIYRYS